MGAVYQAEHVHMHKLVALEVLHAEMSAPTASASAEGVVESPSPPALPPPPSPVSSAAVPEGRPAPTPAAASTGRRTGPGGIYIPPPSQWFK
jgi:hypothetical protein